MRRARCPRIDHAGEGWVRQSDFTRDWWGQWWGTLRNRGFLLGSTLFPCAFVKRGILFLFVIRRRVANEFGDECLFTFAPVFVRDDGIVDLQCLSQSLKRTTSGESSGNVDASFAVSAFDVAKRWIEKENEIWNWDDDVEFLAASICEFR